MLESSPACHLESRKWLVQWCILILSDHCYSEIDLNSSLFSCCELHSAGSPQGLTAVAEQPAAAPQTQHTVIPGADSLIGDLLDMDLGPPMHQQQFQQTPAAPPAQSSGAIDLLGEGLDSLVNIYIYM